MLTLTGCFSEPPSGGTSVGASATSTSGTSQSTGSLETSSSEAGSPADGSTETSEPTAASSSSGGTCEYFFEDVPRVPADIVILVDTGVSDDALTTALAAFQQELPNNLAVLAPEAALANLDLDFDCVAGCESADCGVNPNRVIVPYGAGVTPYMALENLDSFDCMVREPAQGTSGPVTHVWFITSTPDVMPPQSLVALVLDGVFPLRVHLSCPGCDESLSSANFLLANVVRESLGTVSDSNAFQEIHEQAEEIGRPRTSCIWNGDEPQDVLFTIAGPAGPPVDAFAVRVEDEDSCDIDGILDGADGAFFTTGFGVELCPNTCRVVQSHVADDVDVFGCF